mmetsp:Transcript_9885/g.13638  ORF Transcript_9885/g.13638 Transcript_9885/m.13638 type:complete len:207 (+) Transcript_9885:49-669(+)|eukprot:CAMPEP_0185263364 /NCGR_PEP_ID=MMETSP1359-20130426/14538_1 /TAXON_ID=552665 /ORGANISM="Bigelowiella longifila, Strain CCMP242" /LENGTH=206 /DNA_ID=CAMNT_0027850853 /DNA_START=48 /DNA_END=668 /DNA_ORIENTATION=+
MEDEKNPSGRTKGAGDATDGPKAPDHNQASKEVDASEAGIGGLDDEIGTEEITICSKDKKKYTISKKAARMSKLIQTTIEGDSTCSEIELFHIEGDIVERIVKYMQYHETVRPQEIEKPIKSNRMVDLVDSFDAKFCEVGQETMFKLLLAANYMDIKPLLLLMCAKVASLLKGKTPQQIRKTFNIRGDYTPEEEEEVRNEYKNLLG